MQVRVLYLGMLREIAGREKEVVQLRDDSRLGDLFVQLQHRIPQLNDFRGAIALAVNYEYSGGETVDPARQRRKDQGRAVNC
jgi:molybdopterin converting factor small subunit